MRYALCLFVLLTALAGCAPVDRERLSKEVVAKDPEFALVLEKRKELLSRLQTYERELAVRRSDTEKKISQLRKDLVDATNAARLRSAEVKKRMEPDRQRFLLGLTAAAGELKVAQQKRANLGRQMAQLKKSSGDAAQLQALLDQARALDVETASLKERLRLLKLKLLLIKL